jgi:DNA polymerase elongation subunit (family B)
MVNYTWGLFGNDYIPIDRIVQDWSIICGAWKELGSKKIHVAKATTIGDDYEVVKTIRDALADADVIIAHNGDSFDVKKLNARIIFHKLEPLPKLIQVDTKKEAKKVAAFSSNKLDYLAQTLVGEGKLPTDMELWKAVMAGNKKALKAMIEYCKVDVVRLEQVYERLLPYMKNPPHRGVLAGQDRNCSCKACGSTSVKLNGVRFTAAGVKKQEVKCKECHHYSLIPFKEVK